MTAPYYTDGLITLYLGDCMEVTEWLGADVLVTDPPYGIGGDISYAQNSPTWERQEWDSTLDVRDRVLDVWGDRPRAVFGSPRRIDAAPGFREVPLIWDKGDTTGMGDTRFPWRPTYELIYINGDGWTGFRGESMLRQNHYSHNARNIGHPTPKPVALMEAIIQKSPAGSIADPFAGSGATLIAARNLGRPSIGVELDEQYAEAAVRRITGAPQSLFNLESMEQQ